MKTEKLLTQKEIEFASTLGIEVRKGYFLNPGEAHLVFFVDDTEAVDLGNIAEYFAFNANIFPESTNISVCTIVDPTTVRIRTYERASFQETLACGTGSVACACAARLESGFETPKVKVVSRGGEQFVLFKRDDIFLIGPAQKVFCGEIEITTGL